MSFAEALSKCFSNYANASGRARRSEYWYFQLAYSAALFLAIVLEAVIGVQYILELVVYAVFLVPLFTVGIRRMHDCNRSGWWLLLPIMNIVILATEGDAGPNQYGPATK